MLYADAADAPAGRSRIRRIFADHHVGTRPSHRRQRRAGTGTARPGSATGVAHVRRRGPRRRSRSGAELVGLRQRAPARRTLVRGCRPARAPSTAHATDRSARVANHVAVGCLVDGRPAGRRRRSTSSPASSRSVGQLGVVERDAHPAHQVGTDVRVDEVRTLEPLELGHRRVAVEPTEQEDDR